MNGITIDQTKIVIRPDLVARGAAPFPRSLTWWQRTLPIWVDAIEAEDGRIVLMPNGRIADGRVRELTPAVWRSELKQIRRYLADWDALDFSDAIATA